jgi:A/G-specific adenine glycosylase
MHNLSNEIYFTTYLLKWNKLSNNRTMPWKGVKDPYKIWLSEIILQQTKVEQGLAYYLKFIKKYPTVIQLANANDDEVFKLWEGLGYYNRCKNLLFTARVIKNEYKGVFPKTYNEVLNLKGIGTYTAAAIVSFAYNLPYAVVDGNVVRVLARYFGLNTTINTIQGKKQFTFLANKILPTKQPAIYNQAIMDFGATICKPKLPLCNVCVLNATCKALEKNMVNELPQKKKTIIKKIRWFAYFIFKTKNRVWINKRLATDIWQNLYDFYLVETETKINWNKETINAYLNQIHIYNYSVDNISEEIKQQLSHQTIKATFIQINITHAKPKALSSKNWVRRTEIHKLAFPNIIHKYLNSNKLS